MKIRRWAGASSRMRAGWGAAAVVGIVLLQPAQGTAAPVAESEQVGVAAAAEMQNARLILKDGSYQVVRRYEIKGDRVRYISVERAGDWEELPSNLVDWKATEKWARDHKAESDTATGSPGGGLSAAAELDREVAAEKLAQKSRTPEVAPGLLLPDLDGVFLLDTFKGKPELLELKQSTGDVNQNRGHSVLKAAINPLAAGKRPVVIDGGSSKIGVHVNEPVLYVALDGPADEEAPGDSWKVDTKGASSMKEKGQGSSASSRYIIIRTKAGKNTRTISTVNIGLTGKVSQAQDTVATRSEVLEGRHWMKLTPEQPLEIGEYALMEVLDESDVNLSVWDFRVDPRSPEDSNARMAISLSGTP